MNHPSGDRDPPQQSAETEIRPHVDASTPRQDASTPRRTKEPNTAEQPAPPAEGDTTHTLYRALQTKLKNFTLLRKIGSGGFGSVWLAQDTQLNRKVAIKTPHPVVGEKADTFYKRVVREGRAAAALQHPSIIKVYEVDQTEDVPYIVCEYISGISLAEKLALKRLPSGEALELAIPIAEALGHAHDCGIIHRDVKPANILIDSEGVPHIGDFGIAKHESVEETISTRGAVIGTPAYMSPEQASGFSQDADARSDIYSLGVVLFQMLTGERPFRGNRRMLVHQVINDDPPSLRQLEHSVPRDLNTVCLKCLQKEPGRRYQTCRELADELKRIRRGEPIVARPISRAERFYRLCMKHRAVTALALMLLISLVAGLLGVTWQWRRAEAFGTKQQIAREAADRMSAELAEQVKHSRRLMYNSRIALAKEALRAGDYFRLRQHLQLAHQPDFQLDRRDVEWYLLADSFRPIQRIHQHREFVTDVAISPDDELLAAAGLRTISVWNNADGSKRCLLKGHQARIVSLAFSPDGRFLASLDEKGIVRVWNPYNGQLAMPPLSHPGGGTRLRFQPTGNVLATAGSSGTIIGWDTENGTQIGKVKVSDRPIADFVFWNDAGRVVAGSEDGSVTMADWRQDEIIKQFKASRSASRVVSVAADTDKNLVAASLFNGDLVLFDGTSYQPIAEMESGGQTSSIVLMKTQPWIAGVNLRGTIDFWDIENRALVKTHHTHGSYQVQASLAFGPGEHRLAVGSNDGSVKLFKVKHLIKHRSFLVGHDGPVNMLQFSRDGRQLVSVGHDGRANLYDAQTGVLRRQLCRHETSLESVLVSANGDRCFFGSSDGTLIAQDAQTDQRLATVRAGRKGIRAILALPDSDQLITAGIDGGVRLCSIKDQSSKLLFTHGGVVRAALLTKEGKTLITAGTDGMIRFTSAADWQTETQVDDAGAGIYSLSISPSGHQLAVGLQNGRVRVFDIPSGRWIKTLPLHAGPVQSVLFTPSGRTIISGGNDKKVIISDLEIGEKKMLLGAHSKQVRWLALSSDGAVLVSSDNGGETAHWRAPRVPPSFERFGE